LPQTIEDKDDPGRSSATSSIHHHQNPSVSLAEIWLIVAESRGLFLVIVGTSLALCLLYCLIAPTIYEATARVVLKGAPESALALDRGVLAPGSFASGPVQLETVANEFRSEQLAWNVITSQVMHRLPGFLPSFGRKFPDFDPAHPSPAARDYLLDQFQRRLAVESVPHSLVLEIRFRSHDAALSAAVANALIEAYNRGETDDRVLATSNAAAGLDAQLASLKTRMGRDDQRLAEFQKKYGIVSALDSSAGSNTNEFQTTSALGVIESLSTELASARTDRILREAQYRAASAGDPELVLASDPKLQGAGGFGTSLLQQLHARRSDLEQEQALLRIEHGPNFPRVVEIHSQMQDLDLQIKAADAKLVERFRSAWKTALDREQLVKKSLDDAMNAGLRLNEAELKYAAMRQEANANHDVYVRAMQAVEEAGLVAGSHRSALSVIDFARQPVKPVSPNLPVFMAITFFVSFWVALGVVLLRQSLRSRRVLAAATLACATLCPIGSRAQAPPTPTQAPPTPNLSGLPIGVVRIPQSTDRKSVPDAKAAPEVWDRPADTENAGAPQGTNTHQAMPMAAPLGPGDLVQVTESHTPEFRAIVRISDAGTVTLALAGEVQIAGMDEQTAAKAIEKALVDRGMLTHPQVTVLATAYAGQDVSVLGEVARPGVYSYSVHHRLLDLVSAAAGLSPNAGRLVTITHRDDPKTIIPVVLDPEGTDPSGNHNPELLAGDTVVVSRAGLVYVVGDVIRPGGFPVDPVHTTTVAQVLSLAWGPTQNAALSKAVLIREQPGGRTLTTIDLKRLLRGLDPDMPIHDRDILFVPNSMAKNLWNRTMESVIQSAAGVSIYAGLVYSERF
jgi:polysaccharide biosynthesis/export protein